MADETELKKVLETSEKKIEITPEMIEAGLAQFSRFDDRFDERSDAVEAIFLSMWEKSKEARSAH